MVSKWNVQFSLHIRKEFQKCTTNFSCTLMFPFRFLFGFLRRKKIAPRIVQKDRKNCNRIVQSGNSNVHFKIVFTSNLNQADFSFNSTSLNCLTCILQKGK